MFHFPYSCEMEKSDHDRQIDHRYTFDKTCLGEFGCRAWAANTTGRLRWSVYKCTLCGSHSKLSNLSKVQNIAHDSISLLVQFFWDLVKGLHKNFISSCYCSSHFLTHCNAGICVRTPTQNVSEAFVNLHHCVGDFSNPQQTMVENGMHLYPRRWIEIWYSMSPDFLGSIQWLGTNPFFPNLSICYYNTSEDFNF